MVNLEETAFELFQYVDEKIKLLGETAFEQEIVSDAEAESAEEIAFRKRARADQAKAAGEIATDIEDYTALLNPIQRELFQKYQQLEQKKQQETVTHSLLQELYTADDTFVKSVDRKLDDDYDRIRYKMSILEEEKFRALVRSDEQQAANELTKEWQLFIAMLDAHQCELFERMREAQDKGKKPGASWELREEADEEGEKFRVSLDEPLLDYYTDLIYKDSLLRNAAGLEDELPEAQVETALVIDAPQEISPEVMRFIAPILEEALLRYQLRILPDSALSPDKDLDALRRLSIRAHCRMACTYNEDEHSLQFTTQMPELWTGYPLQGDMLRQCIKNTVRELKAGWKKRTIIDPATNMPCEVVMKVAHLHHTNEHDEAPIEDIATIQERTNEALDATISAEFFKVIARVCTNVAERLEQQDKLAKDEWGDTCYVLDKKYFYHVSDDLAHNERYRAYKQKEQASYLESDDTVIERGIALHGTGIIKHVLGDILQISDFTDRGPAHGHFA